jgi:DNA-binding Lrp family transcriptional regulator
MCSLVRVGLTVSPAHRRVRDLEASGAIAGYRAVVDPKVLGLGFEALVFVTMKQEDRATLLGFEAAVTAIPNVLLAQRLFGDPDYLLRVRTTDLDAYARLEDDVLATLPGGPRAAPRGTEHRRHQPIQTGHPPTRPRAAGTSPADPPGRGSGA